MPQTYVPINCEFHDVLEAPAVRGQLATIRYLDDDGQLRVVQARILDLHARDAVEYMRLDDGGVVRLDRVKGLIIGLTEVNVSDYDVEIAQAVASGVSRFGHMSEHDAKQQPATSDDSNEDGKGSRK